MKHKFKMLSLVLALLLVIPAGFSQSISEVYCIDNETAVMNITINTTIEGEDIDVFLTETFECRYGCDNSTGGMDDCFPNPTDPTIYVVVPAFVLFFLTFLLLYISINMKDYKPMQILFLGISLILMIANAWYAQSEASKAFLDSVSDVMTSIYLAIIVVTIITIFYFVMDIIMTAVRDSRKRRMAVTEEY
jgi:hypothetical protein